MGILKNILELFKKEYVLDCCCPLSSTLDPLNGKFFKHNVDGKVYEYLFTALPLPSKKSVDLTIICQAVDDGSFFVCKWNHFFSSTKVDGETVPRFEEQEDE